MEEIMKKSVAIAMFGLLLLFSACAGSESARMRHLGISDEKLKKVVSFDTKCPVEQITVVDKMEDQGFGKYKIEACGKQLDYKRTGTIYHAADKQPY